MLNQQHTDCEYDVVFCDWLDITFPETAGTCETFVDWFTDLGFFVRVGFDHENRYTLDSPIQRSSSDSPYGQLDGIHSGTVKITLSRSIVRVSLSGAALEFLRLGSVLEETLAFFSEFPFHITRIDSALDVNAVGFEKIKDLRSEFPEHCALTQRNLRTKAILSRGLEGRQTGTFYVGHMSKADVTARCYDKRHQLWETKGVDIKFNCFRYEITTRFKRDRGGASLRDVSDPTSLFYNYASPHLRRKPKGVGEWSASADFTFTPPKLQDVLPAVKMKRLIQGSYYVDRLARLSQEDTSGGVAYAVGLFKKELESIVASLEE